MGEWPILALKDAPLEILDGDRGGNYPHQDEFSPSGYCLFLNAGNVTSGGFNFANCAFITKQKDELLRKGKLARNDVVLTTRGTVGNVAFFSDAVPFDHVRINSGMVILRADSSVLDPLFLYLFVRSGVFGAQVSALQTGSAQPQLPIKDIIRIKFPIPPLDKQRTIAAILGALDDKIDVNRRMNETLDAMARAIFKDWFVDFGPTRAKMESRAPYLAPEIWSLFPDRLDDEGKPIGWEERPLDQIADFLNGIALQKYPADEASHLPVIKIAQLRAGNSGSSDRASTKIPAAYIVENGDVLFSWSGSLLHRVWTGGRGALNQHLFKVTSARYPKWFFFHWIGHHMPAFQATAASKATTMGHIQRHHLAEATTVVADPRVMKSADAVIAPLFERAFANDLEARTLAATRDLLLPQLMSGEIRVKDAEKIAEAAL